MGKEDKKGNENTKDKLAGAATWVRMTFASPASSLRLFICLFVAFYNSTLWAALMKEEEEIAARTFHPWKLLLLDKT